MKIKITAIALALALLVGCVHLAVSPLFSPEVTSLPESEPQSITSNLPPETSIISEMISSKEPAATATQTASSIKVTAHPSDIAKPTTDNSGSIYPKSEIYIPIAASSYHYYKNLPDNLKIAYDTLCKNVETMSSGLIELGDLTPFELKLVYFAVKNDRPEYFWLPASYVYAYFGNSIAIGFDYHKDGVNVSYSLTPAQRKTYTDQIRSKISEIQQIIKQKVRLSEYERELVIHDWLLNLAAYDNDAAAKPSSAPMAFTVCGTLVSGKAVCEGYSRTMQLLLNFFGINCTLATGESAGIGHMWNIVNIEGGWYHLDATWNDDAQNIFHFYFNLTDKQIKRDHSIYPDYTSGVQNFNYRLPSCTNEKYNYFKVNGTMIDRIEDVSTVMQSAIASKKDLLTLEFGYSDACANYYKNLKDLTGAVSMQQVFSKVSNDTGRKVNYAGLVVTGNGNFMVKWTIS